MNEDELKAYNSLPFCFIAYRGFSTNEFDINKQLFKNDVEIKLTNKEVDFLTLLCERKNQTVSYNLIQEIVWQNDFMSEDAIRSVARNLRKKVPENCLENVSKIGYKIITLD